MESGGERYREVGGALGIWSWGRGGENRESLCLLRGESRRAEHLKGMGLWRRFWVLPVIFLQAPVMSDT